eukprot:CAMPEP_0170546156 /NCGR_PEP_ID=MMETSP0211-20121228/4527_1 /TAXON_ID=311385 /ORGANISM="Pseudokeronopsis sp., Strain OXSARD2" /LENGTH=84 /DNA_ID=CAMNT_0010850471 /DNA_START=101 /DNA_END=352 /DNA_ORIENTATION=-
MIEDMISDHKNEKELKSALIVCNSFDSSSIEMEDFLQSKGYYNETFQIDRLRQEEREDYLKCFNEMYQVRELPLTFMKVGEEMV